MKPPEYTNIPIAKTFRYGFDALAQKLGYVHGNLVLDYGCGTGRSSRFLKDLGAKVAGVDIREDMISFAKRSAPGLDYSLMGSRIPYPDNYFDKVLACFVHVELGDEQEALLMTREIRRVLKPLGNFFILTMNPESYGQSYESFSLGMPHQNMFRQRVHVKMLDGDDEFNFQDYCWSDEEHRRVLEKAGFRIGLFEKVNAERHPPPFLLIKALK